MSGMRERLTDKLLLGVCLLSMLLLAREVALGQTSCCGQNCVQISDYVQSNPIVCYTLDVSDCQFCICALCICHECGNPLGPYCIETTLAQKRTPWDTCDNMCTLQVNGYAEADNFFGQGTSANFGNEFVCQTSGT